MALIKQYGHWALLPVAIFLYYLFAFEIKRTDHLVLFSCFSALIVVSTGVYLGLKNSEWTLLFAVGLLFRLTFLVSTPHLSDDFYRFTWDGELLKDGYKVFAFKPREFTKNVKEEHKEKYKSLLNAHNDEFPNGMNSKKYHSIYPAVNQLVFFSASLSNSPNKRNLIIIRLWILIAEIVSFFMLRSLLLKNNNAHLLGLYWLHPFIIIELSGNLHLEALAITFTLMAIYFAMKNKLLGSALATSLGIMTKLTPLFLLGAFFRGRPFKNWIILCMITGMFSLTMFFLIVDLETFLNFKDSVGLFFAWFSFNAGPFNMVRDFVLMISGADVSSLISLFFPFITMGILGYIVFIKKYSTVTTLLLLFTTYFMFSPIVHPWYISILIPLGLLSKMIYPLLWSLLIFGTYATYGTEYIQPMPWIYFEYCAVIFTMTCELRTKENWSHKVANFIYN